MSLIQIFAHEPGRLYPSWQENPRLKWARALRDLAVTREYRPVEGVDVYIVRDSEMSYSLFAPGQGAQKFYLNRRATKKQISVATIESIVDALIDAVAEVTGVEPMPKQANDLTLNQNAIQALLHIDETASVVKLDQRTVKSLFNKKLIYDNGPKGVKLTTTGKEALAAHQQRQNAQASEGNRKVMFEHQPNPEQHERFQRRPETGAAPRNVGSNADEDWDGASEEAGLTGDDYETLAQEFGHAFEDEAGEVLGGSLPVMQPPVGFGELESEPEATPHPQKDLATVFVHNEHYVSDCIDCEHKRVLDILMEQSPFVRGLVDDIRRFDEKMQRLRSLE